MTPSPALPARLVVALLAATALVLAGCGSSGSSRGSGGALAVVAGESFWGDIARQIGGSRVQVSALINDASADPHLYEPTARDAERVASARLVIENGLGYDDFINKLLSSTANSSRRVLLVADVLGVHGRDANPHLWYDVTRVPIVAAGIADALTKIDPADRLTFRGNLARFNATLAPVLGLVGDIRMQHAHDRVAYTERVPGYLLADAGLIVATPPGFARAIEDGSEPSPGDRAAMEALLVDHRVKVLIYNLQTTSKVTQHVRDVARQAGVAVVGMTETMPTSEPSYQQWQLDQANALNAALSR